MFTGIVEETGVIQKVEMGAHSSCLTIGADLIFEDLRIGDSVAVNGVCLTATTIHGKSFTADVMHETLNRSSLGGLRSGSVVNLERAMAAGGRFGGHMVSGHIDGPGKIIQMQKDDNALWLTIQADTKILRYIVEKGSITIDGISLTVAAVSDQNFKVSLIPHTVQSTNIREKTVGSVVNLENDILGKYVEKLMRPADEEEKTAKITRDFLSKYGF